VDFIKGVISISQALIKFAASKLSPEKYTVILLILILLSMSFLRFLARITAEDFPNCADQLEPKTGTSDMFVVAENSWPMS
jgi:hypothetical protein